MYNHSMVEHKEEVAVLKSGDYPIHTSQEVDALFRAASDARTGENWFSDEQSISLKHVSPGLAHYVLLDRIPEEIDAGLQIDRLEALAYAQDPDFNFALLYISRLLAPPAPLPPNMLPSGWVDLDDVMAKIGWDPRSAEERKIARRRIWNYLLFGTRARVIGQRTGKYIDPATREEIDTEVDGPVWAFMDREKPTQPALFAEMEVPLKIEVVFSRTWTRLITSPGTAQYLPLGELLGAIPPDRPTGAWARVLGLAIANFWRRQPQAALNGSIHPTRRELLDRYKAKVAPYQEIIESSRWSRVREYWHGALRILVSNQFLSPEGEPSSKVSYNRRDQWLDEKVLLLPGPLMKPWVETCAENRLSYDLKPLDASKRKRGRPKKNS